MSQKQIPDIDYIPGVQLTVNTPNVQVKVLDFLPETFMSQEAQRAMVQEMVENIMKIIEAHDAAALNE